METPTNKPNNQGMLFNLVFNIIIPVVVLSKFSGEEHLGAVKGLIVAMMFPLVFGIYEFISNKKWNFISVFGLVSVLLSGGLSLIQPEGIWFAVKEASMPLLIGFIVLISSKTKKPIVRLLLLNPQIINIQKIEEQIALKYVNSQFEQLIKVSTWLVTLSFLVSAILNFLLAVYILKSPTGTPEFNKELARMTALSFPVITIPSMVVLMSSFYYLIRGITRLTGIPFQELVNNPPAK